ncbi:MAG TPA: AMP-binding protein [Candidatus Thermoplasmatota archaeon]|nr:AMP-binding protein [Candidatus Thermoplasmatota archaeon]
MPDARARLDALLARPAPRTPAEQDALWRDLVAGPLGEVGALPFEAHWEAWTRVFASRPASAPPPPAYAPTPETIDGANATRLARDLKLPSYEALHRWSVEDRDAFWERAVADLGIPLRRAPRAVREGGVEDPRWLPGARLNVVDACFRAPPGRTALVLGREGEPGLRRVSYAELEALVARVAHGFSRAGLRPGDAVSLYLPMTLECVAAYLGIVRAGGVVVSIADSFAPPEVATRNRLGSAKAILTTAAFSRGGRTIDLYAKAREAGSPRAIVVGGAPARGGDVAWEDFLGPAEPFPGVERDPEDVTNVLFSSGTTGDPKAIPWTHLTPLKAAMDGRYHQDIKPDDVVAWPTSIGWMMGPWLLYAGLVNGATVALFEGAPNSAAFLRFARDARVSVLGLVPALVRAWRASGEVRGELSGVRVFSSTGEASNAEDYLWLMSAAGYRAPVIEYCGGTEVGGGHLTGTVAQPQSPATFSTPALGLDFVVLDGRGAPVGEGEMGELFLVPPSIGLSQRLLNRDHHKEYFEGAPRGPNGETLRRHGDEVKRLGGGYWQAHGRADDTMNLGGIKVSSLELERAMDRHPLVYQTAAVAVVPEKGGAELLVVFAVPAPGAKVEAKALQRELQEVLKRDLNPLYRIHDVVLVESLPRTASNKVMRRELRKTYRAA